MAEIRCHRSQGGDGHETKIFIVMEFAGGGELLSKVAQGARLGEAIARRYFQHLTTQSTSTTRASSTSDIKPENLLLVSGSELN
ncbi:hypothetical protein C2S53_013781 [Perilla frutescens var. hirtella]|uniref:Protein kinase domain-containing protein n=1 Tax=Perilla frutescens var. hirtella TaxID=608512 RepID=A0AAD4P6B4_PERFH|nr:hypothetical protein C2S53_013781 [Perilla frutescens var. hirtella]